MLILLVQIIMLKKYSVFIVKQLRQVLYDFRAVKSNLAKNLTHCIFNCDGMKIHTQVTIYS